MYIQNTRNNPYVHRNDFTSLIYRAYPILYNSFLKKDKIKNTDFIIKILTAFNNNKIIQKKAKWSKKTQGTELF